MKNILKQEKGVSLISLAAAVIVIGIVTSLLLYNVKDTKDIGNLTSMYTDVSNITNKVINYYSTYGKIPALEKTGIDTKINSWTDSPIGANDTGKFLVVDLNALENLTLNYGQDFENVKDSSVTDIGNYTNLYVINENSHNVFYLKGVKVEGKMYYTNMDKDTEKVQLRYIDGIYIPDGYTYKSGSIDTEIIIQNDNEKEYKWADVANKKYTVTESNGVIKANGTTLTVDNNEAFMQSVEQYGGFYLSSDNTVLYNTVDETSDSAWSLKYDTETLYTDKNGDTAYIPSGFKVSKLTALNTINKGLVIKNATTLDEYVWIDVPDEVLKDAATLDEIETALKNYVEDYREDGYEDSWYNGCGIDETQYNELRNNMYRSIKKNGGFYIGRYEAGISGKIVDGNRVESPKTSGNADLSVDSIVADNGVPYSQKDKYVYNWVTCNQAQNLAMRVDGGNRTTSLMFGIQWDLACKFIEETGSKTKVEIMQNSTSWGNYKDSSYNIQNANGKYSLDGTTYNSAENITKSNGTLLYTTTGIIDRNEVLNIYDLAGSMHEMTLEKSVYNNVTVRGGDLGFSGEEYYMSHHFRIEFTANYPGTGFRLTIF